MADLGIPLSLEVESDSTSAKSFASRKGLGKQRHFQTRYLWLQDQVASGAIAITKIPSGENVSDVLTKAVSTQTLLKHMEMLGVLDFKRSQAHRSV